MKRVILGITGGIAGYKALDILSSLRKKGYDVRVVMTPDAERFVSKNTCEVLSGHHVYVDPWEGGNAIEHVSLATWADAILVAPTTYNTIGAIANGIASTMLTCVIAACRKPVFLALAMNDVMYANPILCKNIDYLRSLGYIIIEANEGMLACGVYGKGRLQEPKEIIAIFEEHMYPLSSRKACGTRVLITAGRTEEYIDPIRYISNRSSGRMGFALAQRFTQLGADVTLIAGKHSVPIPDVHRCVHVVTAQEMYEACMRYYNDNDIIIACAAVADYRVQEYTSTKIKKTGMIRTLTLEENQDIIASISKERTGQFLVGFALETDDLLINAHIKLQEKGIDMIIANAYDAIDATCAEVAICRRDGSSTMLEYTSKESLASQIVEAILHDVHIISQR